MSRMSRTKATCSTEMGSSMAKGRPLAASARRTFSLVSADVYWLELGLGLGLGVRVRPSPWSLPTCTAARERGAVLLRQVLCCAQRCAVLLGRP